MTLNTHEECDKKQNADLNGHFRQKYSDTTSFETSLLQDLCLTAVTKPTKPKIEKVLASNKVDLSWLSFKKKSRP